MMAEWIDRKQLKADVKTLLADAQVSPKGMTALYLALLLVINLVDEWAGGGQAVMDRNLLGIFVYVLAALLNTILSAGFVLYCMAIRRGERAEYLTLFDGFSFVGKIIGLEIVTAIFVSLWSLLFVIPGIIALYRYRFALYDLYENPGIGVMEALNMSKRQTAGYKGQLFTLDLSYLGWGLLAAVPGIIEIVLLYQAVFQAFVSGGYVDPSVLLQEVESAMLLPLWGRLVISGLWSLAVSLFYLPNYQCVELGYFETAKRTSGVGEGAAPQQDPWNNGMGPDGLGGL